jgi:alpha-galactosidase
MKLGAYFATLGQHPQMGWNTWNAFGCKDLSEAAVKNATDSIVSLGLDVLGYKYVNIDDCWQ